MMIVERTHVGFDVHARVVVAAAIDSETGDLIEGRMTASPEGVVAWV